LELTKAATQLKRFPFKYNLRAILLSLFKHLRAIPTKP
jgi:hypothetical protein